MKLISLFVIFLLCSCATKVKVSYRVPPKYSIKKGEKILLKTSDVNNNLILVEKLKEKLNSNGWVQIIEKNIIKDIPKYLVMKINDVSVESNVSAELDTYIDPDTLKQERTSSANTNGTATFSIDENDKEIYAPVTVKEKAYASSKIKVRRKRPESKNATTTVLRFLADKMIGNFAEDQQDDEVRDEANNKVLTKIANEFIYWVTPKNESVRIKLNDDEDDLEPFIEIVKKGDHRGAKAFLNSFPGNRGDVLFNLGIMNELLGEWSEAVNNYQKACPLLDKRKEYCQKILNDSLIRLQYHQELRTLI